MASACSVGLPVFVLGQLQWKVKDSVRARGLEHLSFALQV